MKKIKIYTLRKKISGDLLSPVAIYLKIRDRFREPLLLESTDESFLKNNRSYICFEPLAGISIGRDEIRCHLEGQLEKKPATRDIPHQLSAFLDRFELDESDQAIFGYSSYEAVQKMEEIVLNRQSSETDIPLARYAFYKYVLILNHATDELELMCQAFQEEQLLGQLNTIEDLIHNGRVPVFPFTVKLPEDSDFTDAGFLEAIEQVKKQVLQGDVFQLVLSRRYSSAFAGDEFNVYRNLRRINPSPYMFYFDYGDFKLFGSSPEAQLIVQDRKATIHPIAGTYKRSGDDTIDLKAVLELQADQKENAEHVMLVDLARNDLSRHCEEVQVDKMKEVQFFSHVIHLVSKVSGSIKKGADSLTVFCDSFPAGTLSGAPKYKAMQLIDTYEKSARSFYGGAIGFIQMNGTIKKAIMIRTFLSKNNVLYYRAGAGITQASNALSESQEVQHKLGALREAVKQSSVTENEKQEKKQLIFT